MPGRQTDNLHQHFQQEYSYQDINVDWLYSSACLDNVLGEHQQILSLLSICAQIQQNT